MGRPRSRLRKGCDRMETTLQARNLELSDALREYVEKKMGKLSKFFQRPLQAQIMLSAEKDRRKAEVTIPMGDLILRGEDETDDIYASVDGVVDKLERQIKKYKTRINRKSRRSGSKEAQLVAMGDADGADEVAEPLVVRSKRFSIKPMFVDEAILQMDLLGHDFFVFTNADTERMNVVYRRRDQNYGLIEPN